MLTSRRAQLTRLCWSVVRPVFRASRSSFPNSSTTRSWRRASTQTRLLPTAPPSRPVFCPERPPRPRPLTSFFLTLFLCHLVSPWRVIFLPLSSLVARQCPQSRSGHLPRLPICSRLSSSPSIRVSVSTARTTHHLVNSLSPLSPQ